MPKLSKRQQTIVNTVGALKLSYPIETAIELLQKCSLVKFAESVDISINLGVDARKSEQVVRGAVVLPHGTGRQVRVAVFAQAESAESAKVAGADIVGFDDLAADIKAGQMDFDVLIATPDAMRLVGQLGQILGPRGLMPNPKVGTVTTDVGNAVKNAKAGQVRYRTDKAGIIHCSIGKINFSAMNIKQNLESLLLALRKAKPTTAKGVYFKKITISTTMGPGLVVDQATLEGIS